MRADFRVLVCGMGSIGERHVRNLIALGVERIAVVRRSAGAGYRTLDRELPCHSSLDEALRTFRPQLTLICNPTSLHMDYALRAAKARSHLLVEKPLGRDLSGITELENVLAENGCKAMVAYMQRFHPLNILVRDWIRKGENGPLGRPLHYHASWGEYLPDWHPWEDYTQSYAARRDLGGGPALTLSHEFDMLLWFFGKPERCVGLPGSGSDLRLQCEHSVDALAGYAGGLVAHVHLDYFQRPPRHRYELIGTRGRATMDYLSGELILERNPGGDEVTPQGMQRGDAEVHRVPEGFDRNAMFVDELKYMFECIEKDLDPHPSIAEAGESIRLALRSLEGSEHG
ncbi:MAG: Gfo/Idh/MocA family oxidoreductase [Fibrobacteria bacterium]